MPRINLLPWREELRKERQQKFYRHLAYTGVMAAALTGLAYVQFQDFIQYQEQRNEFLEGEIQELDKKIREINDLQETKRQLLARMQIIEELQKSRPEIVHLFEELVTTVPDGLHLDEISQSDRALTLKGVAESNARVSAYMRNIEDSEWLDSPDLKIIESIESEESNLKHSQFHVTAKQVSPTDEEEEEQQ